MLDRLPVIVGVGQCVRRPEDGGEIVEPLVMMEEAARLALADAGTRMVAQRIDSVRVVNTFSGAYSDPADALAERLAIRAGERLYTTIGGDTPQWLVNRSADDLAAGRARAVLLAGGEAMHSLRVAAKRGVAVPWTRGSVRATTIGEARLGSHPDEWKYGLQKPVQVYPLFELALRAHLGEDPASHRTRIAALSASFARVAATQPCAWFRDAKSADEIAAVTNDNRMVGYPYPKFMNAILDVDQGAAVIMTTVGEARALGIPASHCVHLHGGGDAYDLWYVRDRVDYASSLGMDAAFDEALGQARVDAAALGPVDLYSCFPIAPQLAARRLGLPIDGSRPLTVTGGLPYFGGPGNNYAMHAIVTMVERLRAAPDAYGLVSALGWYFTKHAVGVYGTRPPDRPWDRPPRGAANARIEATPHPTCVERADGRVRVETYTVLHDRDGAACDAIVVARLENGDRVFANVDADSELFATLERDDLVGTPGWVKTALDGRNRFYPLGA